MAFGLYDTRDNLWLGNDDGPKLFEDEVIAQVSAQVAENQLGWALWRVRARAYPGGAGKIRDEVVIKRTTAQALRRVMGGDIGPEE